MSYDIIGDIAIIKPPYDDPNKILKNILEKHKHIKTVLLQVSDVKPPYRIPEYKILYGNSTETINIEYGLRFKLDILKTYYSPRLANERFRIAKQVKENEDVLVMFSGVNVYPIYISKFSKARIIYSIELNPYSVKYGLENLKLNKINNVITVLGDAKIATKYLKYMKNGDGIILNDLKYINEVKESGLEINTLYYLEWNELYKDLKYKDIKKIEFNEYELKFNRIIMPLPKESDTFLDIAINAIKDKGIIHLYQFFKEENAEKSAKELLEKYSKELNFKYEILNIVKAGDIGPGTYRYCIDFKVYLS